ncbi:2-keto-3-deoxygluconate kinase [Ruegeria intermedia]|uniref:2-keto-3-deoxygluconate kinase n=1 Tax=Ruegeria intermedia TaxID=996115 RepID=A0A1M4ZL58_9RHOB|nr:sugar kinase [Ruegeria intermedia]SHF18306.1 2-keto-3-deoxygluconate kinase [Ruegeria intermedia]
MRVLAIGECMAELSPVGETGQFRLGFAGDTFNTAWYLARVCPQADVAYFTAVGDDALSAQMRSATTSGGMDDSLVQVIQGGTVGLYLISLNHGERSFSYWRGQSAARRMLEHPSRLETACAASNVICFSGITLAILDPAQRAVLLSALKVARASGKTIVFDPNLRPQLWAQVDEMPKTVMQGGAVSDIVLPSYEDEARWFADDSPQATVSRYVDAGATTVIVKNGADPVHYAHAGLSGDVPVEPLGKVVDTTAAGDSFNAEILAGLIEGAPIATRIKRACDLAARVVQEPGALVPVDPTRKR